VELLSFGQELNRLDKCLHVLFVLDHPVQVGLNLLLHLELADHSVDKLYCKFLHIPAQLLLTSFGTQIELVHFLVDRY
jgi:hypothetical protein